MKKQVLTLLVLLAGLAAGMVHYMAWAENKCEELGNTPQECAVLSSEVL